MTWKNLHSISQLDEIKALSHSKPQVIFKHSTRCSISHMAKGRLDRSDMPKGIDFYYLDLIEFRSISNAVAERFAVHHESPQILLIINGECTYEETHNGIRMEEILEQV